MKWAQTIYTPPCQINDHQSQTSAAKRVLADVVAWRRKLRGWTWHNRNIN